MSEFFNEADACRYAIAVVWPDGQRTTFEGIGLTAAQVAEELPNVAQEILDTLAADTTGRKASGIR